MHESAFTFHNLEFPVAHAVLAPGRHRLRGWVLAKDGGNFPDVRVWAQSRLFPAVHGLPRADLATFFKVPRPYALAEFSAVVDLAPGGVEFVFEALGLDGQWREFARAAHRVAADGLAPTAPAPGGAFRWHDFCRGLDAVLRARRQQPDATWSALARRFAAAAPWPRDLRTPELPFIGFLDEPAAVNRCRFGRVPVIGHVFHTSAEITGLSASADLQLLQPLASGRPLPHVGAFYPHYPTAARSGYLGFVDVPAQLPNPVTVRIYAHLADGSLHLVQATRTRRHDADEEKFSYAPAATGDFDAALAAWREALQTRGIPVLEDGDFQPGVAELRERHARRAARLPVNREIPPLRTFVAANPPLPPPRRALLVTHNLNYEGAPLFLLDYARYLAAHGTAISLLSPSDGPLRAAFETAGATIHLVDAGAVFAATSVGAGQAALQTLASTVDFTPFDLVVANTFTTFWAVHAAKAAGRRVLLYIHESTTPAGFWAGQLVPAVAQLAEEAFTLADCISFTTESSRRYHLDYGRPETHRLTPGWVDVAAIEAWLARQTRESLRRRFSLAPDELLVTNVGTVSDRKGQHLFVRAVDLFWRRHPELAARTRFVLLGSRDSAFDTSLRELIAAVNRPGLAVHPETADYLPYYAAADLTVCSSYEESSPRVVLEAMACGTPLLASAVHGIPEIAHPDQDAVLIPAGDTMAWCEALAKILRDPAGARARADRARVRVREAYSATTVLPRHAALAAAVAAGRA